MQDGVDAVRSGVCSPHAALTPLSALLHPALSAERESHAIALPHPGARPLDLPVQHCLAADVAVGMSRRLLKKEGRRCSP